MKKMILVLFFGIASMTHCFSQTDSYAEKVKKMMELAGTEANFQVAIKQIIQMFKQQKTNVPENVWTEFEKEFSQTSLNELIEMLLPVYKKHMTENDLDQIIIFYQTAAGKKLAEKTPLIMQESMAIGQEWGAKIGQKFAERMKAEGY